VGGGRDGGGQAGSRLGWGRDGGGRDGGGPLFSFCTYRPTLATHAKRGWAGPDREKCTALYLFEKSLPHVPHPPSKSDFGLSFAKPVFEVPQLSNPFIFFPLVVLMVIFA
jgi:hypothetical protein